MDLESAGAAATAGLAGAAIETPTGKAGETQHLCSDCGTETIGRFCHQCGQPTHIHRTLLHLGEELLHGVMHFDGRVFRTLPLLLFRPGKLTREWVHGRRTRYVSPLAMFLFSVFVTFMVMSFLPEQQSSGLADVQVNVAESVAREESEVMRLESALAAAAPADRPGLEADLQLARVNLARAEALSRIAAPGLILRDGEATAGGRPAINVNTGNKKLDAKILHYVENPELAFYKFQNTFYKFSFLLVPLSIPFVALLFLWKRGFTLYDHGVFVLYSLSFVSLALLAVLVAGRFGEAADDAATLLFPVVVPLHMAAQLKGSYGLRTFSTAWRLMALLFFCMIVLAIFFGLVLVLGLG